MIDGGRMNTTTEQFHDLGERYLEAMFHFAPNHGSAAGLHEYDWRQPDLSGEAIRARVREVQTCARELAAIHPGDLSADDAFDYRLLQSALESEIYQWEAEQDYLRNPLWYGRALDLTPFLARNYAPLEERVRAAIGYLQNTPRVLRAARENLQPNVPRPFLTISLEMYEGMLAFYDKDLAATAAQVNNEALKAELESTRLTARAAVVGFLQDLKERYLPDASDDYAIGAEKYSQMLRAGELVDMPLEMVLRVGERDLERNLAAAHEVARQIDPKRTPGELAEMLKRDHPTADELIPTTRALLEEIRQFLIDQDIIGVPSEIRALVEPTPEFLRWAFAMMDTPGPFEKVATEAYYYITPPDPDWPPEKQEEWLTSFNRSLLKGISVHEAYPGHYIHFLHVNHRTRGKLRQLIHSYAFVEGWAHYAEEMMLEVGFGDHDPRLRLAQLEEALVRNCRYVCAIKLHTQGMTVDEATKFFMDNAFMDETPARKEALRGTFDPGYLNYTLGKLMILKLREDLRARQGANFNLKKFHDDLLSYGAPPLPLVRAAMLGQADGAIL
jgi:uncharacterized protein (DUF885 family)